MKRSSLLIFLSLVPFFRIVPIASKVQPFGIIFAFRTRNLQRIKLDALDLCILFLCIIIFTCELLSFIKAGKRINLELSVSLVLPLISFIILRRYVGIFDTRVLDFVLILGYLFLLMQVLGVYDFLKPVLSYVISVSAFTTLGGYRGIALFAPEPSNVAFVYCAVLFLYLYRAHEINNIFLNFKILLTLLLIVLSGSGTALMFLLILFIGYNLISLKLLVATFTVASLIFLFVPVSLGGGSLRAISILESVVTMISEGAYYNLELWIKISGPRFAQNFMAYLSPFQDSIFGNIFDDELQSFNADLRYFYFKNNYFVHERALDAVKANSYFGQLVYEFGVAAFVMFFLFVWYFISALSSDVRKFVPWILLAVAIITFRSTTTILTGWIILSALVAKNNIRPVYRKCLPSKNSSSHGEIISDVKCCNSSVK